MIEAAPLNGKEPTPLHELQQLGGWSNYETVLRYAHLSSEHLRVAAERVS